MHTLCNFVERLLSLTKKLPGVFSVIHSWVISKSKTSIVHIYIYFIKNRTRCDCSKWNKRRWWWWKLCWTWQNYRIVYEQMKFKKFIINWLWLYDINLCFSSLFLTIPYFNLSDIMCRKFWNFICIKNKKNCMKFHEISLLIKFPIG